MLYKITARRCRSKLSGLNGTKTLDDPYVAAVGGRPLSLLNQCVAAVSPACVTTMVTLSSTPPPTSCTCTLATVPTGVIAEWVQWPPPQFPSFDVTLYTSVSIHGKSNSSAKSNSKTTSPEAKSSAVLCILPAHVQSDQAFSVHGSASQHQRRLKV